MIRGTGAYATTVPNTTIRARNSPLMGAHILMGRGHRVLQQWTHRDGSRQLWCGSRDFSEPQGWGQQHRLESMSGRVPESPHARLAVAAVTTSCQRLLVFASNLQKKERKATDHSSSNWFSVISRPIPSHCLSCLNLSAEGHEGTQDLWCRQTGRPCRDTRLNTPRWTCQGGL